MLEKCLNYIYTMRFILRSVRLRGFKFSKEILIVIYTTLKEFTSLKSEITQDNFQLAIDAIQPDDLKHFQWVSVLSYLKNLKTS